MTRAGAEMRGRVLTDREHGVLRLAAEGHSNAAIGTRLYLTENTVKTHMRRVLAKLGAVDRAHAVHLAHLSRLLDDTPPLVCGAFVSPGTGSLVKPLDDGCVRCGQPVDSHVTGRFAAAPDQGCARAPRAPARVGGPAPPAGPPTTFSTTARRTA